MKYLILPLLLVLLVSSCKKKIEGCTDSAMYNYDSSANEDNGSCISYVYGCKDMNAYNYNSSANTESNTCINSFIEILTQQGDWFLKEQTLTPGYGGNPTTDTYVYPFDSICHTDNSHEYETSPFNLFYEYEINTLCNISLSANIWMSGTWELSSSNNHDTDIITKHILKFHDIDTSITYDWEISSISDQEFVITRDTMVDGQSRNLMQTYSH